jgi:magnesium chelatase family protein
MSPRQIRKFCALDEPSQALLKHAMSLYGLSARAHDRILKVARTIADLDGAPDITSDHISEAIQYRSLERKWS